MDNSDFSNEGEHENIPEADKKLVADLLEVLDQLNQVRAGLYSRQPGCACDEKRLCALHAAVYNYVFDARVKISLAMKYAEGEG